MPEAPGYVGPFLCCQCHYGTFVELDGKFHFRGSFARDLGTSPFRKAWPFVVKGPVLILSKEQIVDSFL